MGAKLSVMKKGAFIDTNYRYLINIGETTAISAKLKYSDPDKPQYGFSAFNKIVHFFIMNVGVGLMTYKLTFTLGLIVVILAVALLILHKPTPTWIGVYQVEITWKIGENSLIECDSTLYTIIKEAFNQEIETKLINSVTTQNIRN